MNENPQNFQENKIDEKHDSIRKLMFIIIIAQTFIILLMFSNLSRTNKIIKQYKNRVEYGQEINYDKIEDMIKKHSVDYELIKQIIDDKELQIKVELEKGLEQTLIEPETDDPIENEPKTEDSIKDNDEQTVGEKVGEITDYLGEQFKKLIKTANEKLND